ncbi:alkyl/aryl-sulfatase [Vibrio neptunius]|uniref:MBL fold metallo-hydrolase n=1 Tax=Vibrio neptunius TaxID=170651 RepID=A0ABS2ZWK9_9VIBR|nr:alkyl sulfatase dimerization domain-containing protein [Vibrio neptunius]MBN3492000.1 MBL fold metallo-hydrolase [Vibrio neptunius]MBN3514305.1 MBL fold metallo-hydrolase [Vibrio neptunius]MBN3548580.1 MBL fold metallo-hydrolase [Vibrio neptunius]MBN3576626.1 MBL fold metallo-hydrolase [Vibrio neptunius]MCH9870290.1 MBL fold metallo-hydrolase [Vibrio neptunius]
MKEIATLGLALLVMNSANASEPKDASDVTKEVNNQIKQDLPFNDKRDFKDAQRGFVAKQEVVTITNENGDIVWDLEAYKDYISLDKPSPDTVNPSLWRNAQLNMINGLFEVTEGIYQVRGYDLSNITFIKGDTGWIVFDPLISQETAKAALNFINQELGERPVTGVFYSHSHIDHFGGVRGVVDEKDVISGKVPIVASYGFTEHAVSENVIAGNAMGRRAVYMYGALLPRNEKGGVNGGLGQTTSTGIATMIKPTDIIKETGEKRTIDGVKMVFQYTPGSEAPTEMNIWFPDKKALWMAENTTNTMHNILTLRGAQVRDALKWSSYLQETIDLWGDEVQVKFQSHHWPMWGQKDIVEYFKTQRDMYKYTHDQTVRLMNQGYIGSEISEMIEFPDEIGNTWSSRGYYGTLRHNSRAVYQRYMGWYNGNPSDLNNLPPADAAEKYVEYMGGEQQAIKKAKADFDKGHYRWVAEVLKHVVFANPESKKGKELLADTYEQLGYQAESGPWRSVYLQGAYELRNGTPSTGGTNVASPDIIKNMPPEMLFDYLAVRILPEKAAGKTLSMNINFTDLDEQYALYVENSVLNHTKKLAKNPGISLALTKTTLDDVQLGKLTLEQAIADGSIQIEGDPQQLKDFVTMLDSFNFWFNIVIP